MSLTTLLTGPVRRPPRLLVDAALAIALAGLTWATLLLDDGCGCRLPAWARFVVLGQTLPLALRRSAPVPVWAVVGLMTSRPARAAGR